MIRNTHIMTKEQLERYAAVVVSKYAPQSRVGAAYDMRHNVYDHKLNEVRSLIIDFPVDLDMAIKEEVANAASQQLRDLYKDFF